MHILFVHQNFPAQFRYIAPRLATDYGWTCTFATERADRSHTGIERILYRPRSKATHRHHFCTRAFENAIGHAHGVYEALKARPDVQPDLVVAHSGFGSSLFLPYLYDAPIVNFFEYFYRPLGRDLGFRPDMPVTEISLLHSSAANATMLLDLDNCNRGWCPSYHQRELLPPEYQHKVYVCPEGVDTNIYSRRENPRRHVGAGRRVDSGTRVVTYVSRGLEMMRGFDIFMKAAKLIYQQFPDVLFVIVGTDKVYYGNDAQLTKEPSFREYVLKSDQYDLSHFHFTGAVPEETLAEILSVSDLHVYLTVPFVTSWSMLDAMSCSCVVLASSQACVREYITHGHNGLLCDFFDVEGIASKAVEVLRDPVQFRHLGDAARRTLEEQYSLSVTLPRLKEFFETTGGNPRRPSHRRELLVRAEPRGTAAPDPQHGRAIEQTESPPAGTRPIPALCDSPGTASSDEAIAARSFDGTIPWCPDQRPGRSADSDRHRTVVPPHTCGDGDGSGNGKRSARIGRPATIVFAWELGGGLGHLMQMLPLAKSLVEQGHRVFVALRRLAGAEAVFSGTGVCYIQAPHFNDSSVPAARPFPVTLSFSHILCNTGWYHDSTLFEHACAWRNLFRMVRPDLVIFDHSPTALLACRGMPARRALLGSGFCCPPDTCPWPLFHPTQQSDVASENIQVHEEHVLRRANRLLKLWGWPELQRLGQLYGDVDENFLTTLPELDHFVGRKGAAYWGPVLPRCRGKVPIWPDGSGKRVFAYLKPFPALPNLLERLNRTGCSTLVYLNPLNATVQRRFESPTLRFECGPLKLAEAARECDLAVLNGGHGATAEILMAGKPILQVPLVLEQRLTAAAVAQLGAGEEASPRLERADEMAHKLELLLSDGRGYVKAAGRVAARYAAFEPARQQHAMLRRSEELLANAPVLRAPVRASSG